ncbi:MAG: hypothetical protein GX133_06480 [Syntrophomonadaceae bacterium]|nr:hypothetical protein [Syntrophomonadaceae bacterium]
MATYLLRLALAGIAGFLLGLVSNRQDKTKSSAVFAIVCISSALLFIVALGVFQKAPGIGDPARLIAQVLSALGFLFAGIVWIGRDKRVEGTNTAAALLLTALVGMLIGAGRHQVTLAGVLLFVIIYWLSDWIRLEFRGKRVRDNAGEKNPPG